MDLGRIQALSLITKAVTTALGVIQSIIVIRLLSPAEFGLVGLVMSIGGVIGVSQHLGIVDGAIREIAVLKNKWEIGKVFWVSHAVRQLVTIPLSLGLVLLAGIIANRVYGRPEITLYLQVFAAALILQGLQDVLGAALTGLKKFWALYAVQILTAAINIGVFGYLTWQFGITGFFWAVIITTAIMVGLFFALIARELRGFMAWPSWEDFRQYGRRVLRIGMYMYLARIFFVIWQRMPLLMLGGVLAAEELGFLNVSMTFGSRLTIIAMALSEVNLAWMSSLFAHRPEEFRRTASRNMQRVFMIMAALTAGLMFFTPEIILLFGREYIPAEPIIYVMTFAFFLYALIDIGTSSVFVPADQPRLRALVYGVMVVLSGGVIGWLLITRPSSWLAAWGVLLGAVASYIAMVWLVKKRFAIQLLPSRLVWLLAALGLSLGFLLLNPPLSARFLLAALLGLAIVRWSKQLGIFPDFARLLRSSAQGKMNIVCIAAPMFDLPYWTNRQHIMSRLSQQHPVLYIEARVWIIRHVMRYWNEPRKLMSFLWRLVGYQKRGRQLYLISQWNLIPGSREYQPIASLNHWLNRWRIMLAARLLGFSTPATVLWIYDTEAAEYLSAWPKAAVMYDCVDDHVAQAGAERNPKRVKEEEEAIMKRADIVTVTSRRLLGMKKNAHANVQLVLNAGDVKLFSQAQLECGIHAQALKSIPHPIIGTVGALDEYKIDVDLIMQVARAQPEWQFVFVGEPVLHPRSSIVRELQALPNVHFTGAVPHRFVPCYVREFDVCMIPYRSSAYNAASFPLKFWEFMATGKPIVAAGVPELRAYQEHIGYAATSAEFIQLCEEALRNPAQAEQRQALAQDHSWEKRVERLLALLRSLSSPL